MPCSSYGSYLFGIMNFKSYKNISTYLNSALNARLFSVNSSRGACCYIRKDLCGKYVVYPDHFFFKRLCSGQKTSGHLNFEKPQSLNFQDMLKFKQQQARNSLLIELSSKNDYPDVINFCREYGEIKKIICFSGEVIKMQMLVEFSHEMSVHKVLNQCCIKNLPDVYPFYSRCVKFENRRRNRKFKVSSNEMAEILQESNRGCDNGASTISEMMIQLFEEQKISDLSSRLRFLSCIMLQDVLSGIFPKCAIFPFGSSVNGFGKSNSDLDAVAILHSENTKPNAELFFQTRNNRGNIRDLQRRTIFALGDILQTFFPGTINVQKILNARVPILKYKNIILGLECDISINNMAGVYMSEILYFCGELDPRVRPLVCTIKKWAKEAKITCETPGSWITNFSLSLLVIYFLQTRPVPILPPLSKMVKFPTNNDTLFCCVKYLCKDSGVFTSSLRQHNTENLETLLTEFFRFLSSFPFKTKGISLLTGLATDKKDFYPIWIDYPISEGVNVAKNVSQSELEHLYQSALAALKNLETNSPYSLESTDLMSVLGVQSSNGLDKIDVQTFLSESAESSQTLIMPSGARC